MSNLLMALTLAIAKLIIQALLALLVANKPLPL
jgi:hypothetical protein